MSQGEANPSVVQQLMFNRILAYVRLLSVDHVNVTGFDTKTGSIEGRLAGVSFIVNVTSGETSGPQSHGRKALSQGSINSGRSSRRPERHQRRADAAIAALETSDEALVLLDTAGKAEFATPRALRLLAANGLTLSEVPHIDPLLAHAVRPGVLLLSERRPFGLTKREREILALIADGRTNAEVATALWISPATVGKHLENAYTKLGVTTRTAAVHCARQHRIIAM